VARECEGGGWNDGKYIIEFAIFDSKEKKSRERERVKRDSPESEIAESSRRASTAFSPKSSQ
jgi:hypothetical protein